jgi:uncharacterized protein
MARSVLVDTGFLVGLLRKRDERQRWAAIQATTFQPPWLTCEAVLSEAYHLLEEVNVFGISAMLRRGALSVNFKLTTHLDPVLRLIEKYADVPMSLADACLVRMTEILDDPVVLTTDDHFRVYRRHSRQVVPCVLPD